MANFLTYFKKNNPNMYSLIVSLLLALWYNGISGLINHYMPNRGPILSFSLLMIPLTIFLTDDGHLDELYLPSNIQYPVIISSQAPSAKVVANNNGFAAKRTEKFVK